MKKHKYPVVYIHKWWPKYLEISIKQSLKNGNDVILIWDEKNLDIAKKYNIKHVNFDDYNKNDFEKYYVHDTRWVYWFELICFQRRFVLLDVMKAENLERCVYLDSDILYYWNAEEEFKRIESYWDYDLAFPNFSGHTTYVFSQKALQEFCDFMLNCYKDEKLYKELLDISWLWQPKRSDMSIFQLYIGRFPEQVFDLKENHWDYIVYDWYINRDEWYKTIFWKKYFKVIKNKAYIYKGKKRFEIKTLHFQMHMKFYMWMVFLKQLWLFRVLLLFNYIVEWSYWKVPFVRYLRKRWKSFVLFK